MRVAFAADHAGAELKDALLRRLAAPSLGHVLIGEWNYTIHPTTAA